MENNNQKMDFGSIIGIVLVLLVLIAGAFYFIGQRLEKQKEFQNAINQNQVATTTATTSDEITDIEEDINSMNVDDLGSDIDNL